MTAILFDLTTVVVRREPNARQRIRQENFRSDVRIAVLDDDPTGCQTVYDVPVLFRWDASTLANVVRTERCFYILHNARSVTGDEAKRLNEAIIRSLKQVAPTEQLRIISRSDSTLRGHFWPEIQTLEQEAGPFDGVLVVPYFGEGGRVTINDTHYIANGDELIPIHETEFARDPVFGFSTAYLPDWIAQQSAGRWTAADVHSITLHDIRVGGVTAVADKLLGINSFSPVVVNATCDEDLEIVVLGLQLAERQGKQFLYRTAASFVKIRAGLTDQPLYQLVPDEQGAGLVIVGSHVPKTTRQVQAVREQLALPEIQLRIDRIIGDFTGYHREVSEQIQTWLSCGLTPFVFTQRDYALTGDADKRLRDGQRISAFLSNLVRSLTVRPRFILAKGGITSHDIAEHGLGLKSARVLGQLRPGIPVWRADSESRFPDLLYVVFPGNVGTDDDLVYCVQKLMS